MQEETKFCPSCRQQNYIGAANCHWCGAAFQHPEFKNPPNYNDIPDFGKGPQKVIVVDFDMKFSSMILFMVKWAIAAIPAMIIIFFAMAFILIFLGGIGKGLR